MDDKNEQLQSDVNSVESHYTRPGLENTILSALKDAGKNVEQLTADDLAPISEFHLQGREASSSLAALLNLQTNHHVLDVGVRHWRAFAVSRFKFGCKVTGLDLVGEYSRISESFAKKVKLDNLLDYRQGDATQMPFEDGTFDVAWTQHASMNIADKKKLYGEIYRVLKPGGRFVMFDVLRGSNNSDGVSMHFPVPWAKEASISHLASPEELRALLQAVGFKEISWEDKTSSAMDWLNQMKKRAAETGGPPLIGLHTLVGNPWPELIKNVVRNLEEGRIAVAQGVFKRG
jgi:SAM-dependent methyltransferase